MSLVLKISSKHIHVQESSYATSIHDHGKDLKKKKKKIMVLATQVSVTKVEKSCYMVVGMESEKMGVLWNAVSH